MHEWALSCALAYALDLCVGDPAWFPHPVRGIGALIRGLEAWLHPAPERAKGGRGAGVALVTLTVGAAMGAAAGVLALAARWGRGAHLAAAVLLMWSALATRDLLTHGETVRAALRAADLPRARRAVGRMVSRDTAELDARGVARSCLESLAENLTDGCLSPFLFGLCGGPVAAWGLKAVSTLDSMVGYRNERYREFGWAAARCDDALHYLPARSLWLILPLACWCSGASAGGCWRGMRREGDRSPSPNSGLPEAGVAGALGVELGGASSYGGERQEKPRLNAGGAAPGARDIRRAQRLVLAASALPALLAAALAGWGGRF